MLYVDPKTILGCPHTVMIWESAMLDMCEFLGLKWVFFSTPYKYNIPCFSTTPPFPARKKYPQHNRALLQHSDCSKQRSFLRRAWDSSSRRLVSTRDSNLLVLWTSKKWEFINFRTNPRDQVFLYFIPTEKHTRLLKCSLLSSFACACMRECTRAVIFFLSHASPN